MEPSHCFRRIRVCRSRSGGLPTPGLAVYPFGRRGVQRTGLFILSRIRERERGIGGPCGGGTELRGQLAALRKFAEGFNLPRLNPDRSTISHHPGFYVYLLSNPGEEYAAYLEGTGSAKLVLNLPSGKYTVKWIDAKTAGY